MDACVRSGNLTRAHEALDQLRAAGLQPNVRTYSIMIHVCARGREPDEAFEWLERMEAVRMEARVRARPTGAHGG